MGGSANGDNAGNSMWGNGAAIAKVLACEHGAKVSVVTYAAGYTQERIETEGDQCRVMAVGVMQKSQVDELIKACLEKYVRIDVLVNKYV